MNEAEDWIVAGPMGRRTGQERALEAFAAELERRGRSVTAWPLSTPPANLVEVLRSGKQVVRVLGQLALHRRSGLVLGLRAGRGAYLDALILFVSRVNPRRPVLLHHESWLTAAVHTFPRAVAFWLGKAAVHVTLGREMSLVLRETYCIAPTQVVEISNAAFVDRPEDEWERTAGPEVGITVGFLSNLTLDKGTERFVSVASQAKAAGLQWHFLLAGPADDPSREVIGASVGEPDSNITYLGPLDGKDKYDFYRGLSVFLMPSRHSSEAEPLVILEAASMGVPSVAYRVGCVGSLLEMLGGIPIDSENAEVGSREIEALALLAKADRESVSHSYVRLAQQAHAALDRAICEAEARVRSPG